MGSRRTLPNAPTAAAVVSDPIVAPVYTSAEADQTVIGELGLTDYPGAAAMADQVPEDVKHERLERLVGLFRLDFADPREMRADVAGRPVYLGLAFDAAQTMKLKPQNLLVNLPVAKSV